MMDWAQPYQPPQASMADVLTGRAPQSILGSQPLGTMPGLSTGGITGGQPLNWFQNLQGKFNNSKFGSGLNSMAGAAGGWGNLIGGASTILQGLAAWDASKLGRDQFEFSKDVFLDNYGAKQQMIENNLRDTWAARNAYAQADGRGGYAQTEQSFLDQRGIDNSRVG